MQQYKPKIEFRGSNDEITWFQTFKLCFPAAMQRERWRKDRLRETVDLEGERDKGVQGLWGTRGR